MLEKVVLIVAICLATTPFTLPSVAEDGHLQSAGWFLDVCRREVEDPGEAPDLMRAMNAGVCLGFINGFARSKQIAEVAAAQVFVDESGLSLVEAVEHAQPITDTLYGCIESTTYQQQAAVFVKYAREHPETWHEDVQIVFLEAMREAFPPPCE